MPVSFGDSHIWVASGCASSRIARRRTAKKLKAWHLGGRSILLPGPPKEPKIISIYPKRESIGSTGSITLAILEVQVDGHSGAGNPHYAMMDVPFTSLRKKSFSSGHRSCSPPVLHFFYRYSYQLWSPEPTLESGRPLRLLH